MVPTYCTIVQMEWVVDANILLSVALGTDVKARLVALTRSVELVAPEVLPYEVGNAVSALVKRGALKKHQAKPVLDLAAAIKVRLLQVDISASVALAAEQGLYAYDAYYLQIALSHALPLLTLDKTMRRVGGLLGIEIRG